MKGKINKNKKGIAPLMLLIAGAVLIIAGSLGYLSLGSIIGSDGYIQVPHYATLKCEQSGVSKDFTATISSSGGDWLNLPENTNEYSVRLISEKASAFSTARRFEYYICPQKALLSNCVHKYTDYNQGGFDTSLGTISGSKYVWAEYQGVYLLSYRARSGASYQITYKPFVLIRYDSLRGGQQEVSSTGCQVPGSDISWTNRILSTDGLKIPNGVAKSQTMQPGERFNYVSGTITRMSEGNVENGKYCIYSNGQATLYDIKQLVTASNTYNVVDTDAKLGTQECCSGDNLPDRTCQNGKWVSTATSQCSLINPCEGSEYRRDYSNDMQVIKYSCVSGKCVAQTKQVECNKDTDCTSNMRCDTNKWSCVMASNINIAGDESLPTDQATCEKKGYNWIPKKTEKSGGFLKIFGTKEIIIEAHCEKPTSWWITLAWIVLFGAIAFVLIKSFPFIRHSLKSIPYVGRIIP